MDLLIDDISGSVPAPCQPFTILSGDCVFNAVQRIVSTTGCVARWPPITCRLLLDHYRWDAARLLDQFFTHSGSPVGMASFFAAANVPVPNNDVHHDAQIQPQWLPQSCSICCCDDDGRVLMDLTGCGHRYCSTCWTYYVQSQIRDVIGGGSMTATAAAIRCPAEKCARPLPDEQVVLLLERHADGDGSDQQHNNAPLIERYRRAICQSFVRHTAALAWCPSAAGGVGGCGRAVRLHNVHAVETTVRCACGHRYCFNCGQVAHDPLPCFLMQRWTDSERLMLWLDGASAAWMRSYAKLCPQCRMPIEKTEGCDHMQCRECEGKFNWSEVAHGDVQVLVSTRLAVARKQFQRFDQKLSVPQRLAPVGEQLQMLWQTLRNVTVLLFFVRDYETERLQAFYRSLEQKLQRLVTISANSGDDHHISSSCADAVAVERSLVDLVRTSIGNWNFTE